MNPILEQFQSTLPDGYLMRCGVRDDLQKGSRLLWLQVKTLDNYVLEVQQYVEMESRLGITEAELVAWWDIVTKMGAHIHDD